MAIVSLDGRPVPPELPRAQLSAIAHRGEWEPSLWEAPGVALGHVNLPRTPEAEREFLPMSDPSGRYWLTWDGRLDNRDELGPQLGYDVAERAQKTDAAYVLDAFIKWGDDCVHHLLGDWAVVIWDNEARRLFCAKDPLGWRQLYYAEHEGLLAVGSEPQQFFADGWLPKVANEEYVLRFLADALQSPGATCYRGVEELWGGQILVSSGNRTGTRTFWRVPEASKPRYKAPKEFVEHFAALFDSSVQARMRSNRPVGVLLSGGIDSSYIAAVAAQYDPSLVGLTGYAEGTTWMDERGPSQAVAAHLGITQHSVEISDCHSLSSKWLAPEVFDQPDHPPQGALHVRLGLLAKQRGLGIVMGGEGADEWMTGTPSAGKDLMAGQIRSAVRRLRASKRGMASAAAHTAWVEFVPTKVREFIKRPQTFAPFVEAPIRPSASEKFSTWESRSAMGREWQLYRDRSGTVIGWRDRHAFAPNGIELRTPFNDLRIVEFMAATPDRVKQFRGR